MVTDAAPPKVTPCSVPGATAALPGAAGRATVACATCSAAVPKRLDSRIRTSRPAMDVCTMLRIVQSVHAKPVSTPDGAASQVPVHRKCPAACPAAGLAVLAAPDVTVACVTAPTADGAARTLAGLGAAATAGAAPSAPVPSAAATATAMGRTRRDRARKGFRSTGHSPDNVVTWA